MVRLTFHHGPPRGIRPILSPRAVDRRKSGVDGTDNDWDILSARELSDVEAKRYDEAVRRTRRRGGGDDAP
ncbi:hypothetical protein GCM10010429_21700 [Micromonospora olivasterospora]